MSTSFDGHVRVLALRGVPVRVHWSVFAVAIGLVWWFDDKLAAGTIVLAYFGLVLAHELGHVLAALAIGLPVHAVELSGLGGRAMVGLPKRTRDVVLVFSAGVVVQFVILLLALAWLEWNDAWHTPLGEVIGGVLVYANAWMIAFNLVPIGGDAGERTDGVVLWRWFRHRRYGEANPLPPAMTGPTRLFPPDTALLDIDSLRPRRFVDGIELFNDHTTPMDLVVRVLQAHAGLSLEVAQAVTMDIHRHGGALVPLADAASAASAADGIRRESADAGHALACRSVHLDAKVEGTRLETITYRDKRFDGRQQFELRDDAIRAVGQAHVGGKYDRTLPLWILSAVPHQRWYRPQPLREGILLVLAWPLMTTLGLSWMSPWGGFLAMLGGVGAWITIACARRLEIAEFRTRSGMAAIQIVRAGPDRARFDAFVAEVAARIAAVAAPVPGEH